MIVCLVAAASGGCGGETGGGQAAVAFNPCATLELALDAQAPATARAALQSAVALWNGIANTRLTSSLPAPGANPTADSPEAAAPAPAVVPIEFEPAAPPFHGYYNPSAASIQINDDLTAEEAAVAIAHEVGHAFGLVHVPASERASVMNPGDLNVQPTMDDAGTLAERWGDCAPR